MIDFERDEFVVGPRLRVFRGETCVVSWCICLRLALHVFRIIDEAYERETDRQKEKETERERETAG